MEEFQFSNLKIEDLEECTLLVAETFAKYDPLSSYLKLSKADLYDIVKAKLISNIQDNLVVVAKDKYNNIVGSYAGYKLSKLTLYNKNERVNNLLIFNEDLKFKEKNEKLKVVDFIDYNLLKERFEYHKNNNELDTTIFCDFYCISEKYFNTSLSKELALNFFKNTIENNITNIYGTFVNNFIKAVLFRDILMLQAG